MKKNKNDANGDAAAKPQPFHNPDGTLVIPMECPPRGTAGSHYAGPTAGDTPTADGHF